MRSTVDRKMKRMERNIEAREGGARQGKIGQGWRWARERSHHKSSLK